MRQFSSRAQENNIEGERSTVSPHIQHQWPVLGQELVEREECLVPASASSQHRQALQEHLRQETLTQLYQADGQYSRATRYLAFLLLKYGRGAEIVGNPVVAVPGGDRLALPYTGLEGYYAGSAQTNLYPGLSQSDILHEEAERGVQIVKRLKKDAVEQNSWAEYIHLRHVLEGKAQQREMLRKLQTLWLTQVSQLRSRVYHNPEFALTPTELVERSEQVAGHGADQSFAWQKEHNQLKEACAMLSEEEKVQERNERKRRETIRGERVQDFQRFRDATYHLLEESNQDYYEVNIQDSSWDKASLIETIVLPRLPAREAYPLVEVHFTSEELDGYLFLAQLGEIGADPLTRSDLVD